MYSGKGKIRLNYYISLNNNLRSHCETELCQTSATVMDINSPNSYGNQSEWICIHYWSLYTGKIEFWNSLLQLLTTLI